MADTLQLRLDIRWRCDIAILEMSEVELDPWLETPFERDFVDANAGFATFFDGVIHRREEVIGCIQMRAIVRADVASFDCTVLSIR